MLSATNTKHSLPDVPKEGEMINKKRIRPNYRNVRSGFSQLLANRVKYVSTYTKGTLKKDQRRTYLMILMRCIFFFFVFFLFCFFCLFFFILIFFIKHMFWVSV